jgi:hypothetical protein
MLGRAPSASTASCTPALHCSLREKCAPRSSKELLGHCAIAITLDTYAHDLLDMQDHATRDLENALVS